MPIRSSLVATFVFEEPRCNFAAGYLELMGRLAEREGRPTKTVMGEKQWAEKTRHRYALAALRAVALRR